MEKISGSLKTLLARLGGLFKVGSVKSVVGTERRRAPTRQLPEMEPDWLKESADGLFRGMIPRMRKEISALFRVAQTTPKKFLVVGFNQARVEIVHAESLPTGLQVLACETVRIPPDRLDRDEVIKSFISDFLRNNEISEREVVMSVPGEESVVIHNLELPILPKGEVLKAGKWKLKEDVPFDLETATIDWQFTRERTSKDGAKNNEYIFTIAQKEAINKYLALLQKNDLHPIRITVGPFNYANILKRQQELPQVTAVLDTDYAFAMLSIYIDGGLCFVRKLPVSWKTFTHALTRILVSEEGPVTLSEEEAEKMQNTVGIPLDGSDAKQGDVRRTNIMFLLRPALEALVRELRLSFNYFAINFDIEKPRALYVVKSGLRLKNLEQYLHKELNMEVSCLTLPPSVEMPVSGESDAAGEVIRQDIVNSVGAALGDVKTVNLLPWEIKAQRIEFLEQVFLRFVGITVAVIFLALVLAARIQIKDYQNRIKIAQVHLRVIGGIKILKEELREKEALIEKIQKGKIPAQGLLKVIGVLIPKPIVLNELSLEQTNHNLILKGTVSASQETTGTVLAGFMQQLEVSSFIEEARLISSRRMAGNQEFEISCDLMY